VIHSARLGSSTGSLAESTSASVAHSLVEYVANTMIPELAASSNMASSSAGGAAAQQQQHQQSTDRTLNDAETTGINNTSAANTSAAPASSAEAQERISYNPQPYNSNNRFQAFNQSSQQLR
jgi:hypothetical protein